MWLSRHGHMIKVCERRKRWLRKGTEDVIKLWISHYRSEVVEGQGQGQGQIRGQGQWRDQDQCQGCITALTVWLTLANSCLTAGFWGCAWKHSFCRQGGPDAPNLRVMWPEIICVHRFPPPSWANRAATSAGTHHPPDWLLTLISSVVTADWLLTLRYLPLDLTWPLRTRGEWGSDPMSSLCWWDLIVEILSLLNISLSLSLSLWYPPARTSHSPHYPPPPPSSSEELLSLSALVSSVKEKLIEGQKRRKELLENWRRKTLLLVNMPQKGKVSRPLSLLLSLFLSVQHKWKSSAGKMKRKKEKRKKEGMNDGWIIG